MKVLVTGVDGFIGHWLTKELKRRGYEVFGLSRQPKPRTDNVGVHRGDLINPHFVRKILKAIKPDIIFHLAAQSSIVDSFTHPAQTIEANVIGTVNILEALRHEHKRTILLSIGSSAEYGETAHSGRMLTEDSLTKPLSPYAITKVSQEMFCALYKRLYNLSVVHVRLFAIIGPGKKGDAIGDFARGIAAIEQRKEKILSVGDLTHKRDFMDVRDATRALVAIARTPRAYGVYNVCTGTVRSLEQMLAFFKKKTKETIVIQRDPVKNRPSHDPVIVGSPKRLKSTGFKPRYTIYKTLSDILEYWRREERKK